MKTIHFEDHDQDFLTWTIDEEGVVIDCQPFQLSVWRGTKVVNHMGLKPGQLVHIEDENDPERTRHIKYPVEKVTNEAIGTTHRNFVPLVLFMLLTLFVKSQPCRETPPEVFISTSCHSVCVAGTFKVDTNYCGWFLMTAGGAQNYTWTINGAGAIVSPTVIYNPPPAPGITNYLVTGSVIDSSGLPCYGQAAISVTAVACMHGSWGPTGYQDQEPADPGQPAVYFDLLGNRIEKRFNEVLIEQRGISRRKVYYEKI